MRSKDNTISRKNICVGISNKKDRSRPVSSPILYKLTQGNKKSYIQDRTPRDTYGRLLKRSKLPKKIPRIRNNVQTTTINNINNDNIKDNVSLRCALSIPDVIDTTNLYLPEEKIDDKDINTNTTTNNNNISSTVQMNAQQTTIPTALQVHDSIYSDQKRQMRSVVKVFCQHVAPNFAMPWQVQEDIDSTSSGFVISNRRIQCNAHGIVYGTSVKVRKHGDSKKYPAKIAHIGHGCDLAILIVDDESFWHDLYPLEFGSVPEQQDRITVVGYPTGGDNICITSGVVSRIGVSTYEHSQQHYLTIQIDAAINEGNSGGPAFCDDKVVGIAFESLDNVENCGFIIPVPIIRHFLLDIENSGHYRGFGHLNVDLQNQENAYLRKRCQVGSLSSIVRAQYPEFSKLRDEAISIQSAKDIPSDNNTTNTTDDDITITTTTTDYDENEWHDTTNDNEQIEILETSYKFSQIPFQCKCYNENGTLYHLKSCIYSESLENFNCIYTRCEKNPYDILTPQSQQPQLELAPSVSPYDTTINDNNVREKKNSKIYYERCTEYEIEFILPNNIEYPSPSQIQPPNDTSDDNYGLQATKVIPQTKASQSIKESDVIISFDGIPIAADGTINFRDGERVSYTHLFSSKFQNEEGEMIIIRKGIPMKFQFICENKSELVKSCLFEYQQPYFIYCGFVFQVLSGSYQVAKFGHKYEQNAPVNLVELQTHASKRQKYIDEDIVILSQILSHEINMGYDNQVYSQVVAVNGTTVRNLRHLAEQICTFVHTQDIQDTSLQEQTLHSRSKIIIDVRNTEVIQNDIQKQRQIPLPGSSIDIRPMFPLSDSQEVKPYVPPQADEKEWEIAMNKLYSEEYRADKENELKRRKLS